MSNIPTILISINGQEPTTINLASINPFVSFDPTTNLTPAGVKQPPNWYYYLIKYNGTGIVADFIAISITASSGYPLPAINFMLTGSGGSGGAGGAGTSNGGGGGGGGGGTGGVVLINNYYSEVSPTLHAVNLYPLGSYNSVMYLDIGVNNKTVFYAYTGLNGGNGDSTDSANGGNAGDGGTFTSPASNLLPSYCSLVRGGAGGNKGVPKKDNSNKPGASYNGALIPSGSGQEGSDSPAYIPLIFADGLSGNITAGTGGTPGPQVNTPGSNGASAPPSMFMLYFQL